MWVPPTVRQMNSVRPSCVISIGRIVCHIPLNSGAPDTISRDAHCPISLFQYQSPVISRTLSLCLRPIPCELPPSPLPVHSREVSAGGAWVEHGQLEPLVGPDDEHCTCRGRLVVEPRLVRVDHPQLLGQLTLLVRDDGEGERPRAEPVVRADVLDPRPAASADVVRDREVEWTCVGCHCGGRLSRTTTERVDCAAEHWHSSGAVHSSCFLPVCVCV